MQVIFVFFILCGLIDKVGGDSISCEFFGFDI
jgi:hypothetical protein